MKIYPDNVHPEIDDTEFMRTQTVLIKIDKYTRAFGYYDLYNEEWYTVDHDIIHPPFFWVYDPFNQTT